MTLWKEAPITEIFGMKIYTFGLYCMIGVLCAMAALFVFCRAHIMKKGTAPLLSLLCTVCGIIASRLVYCISSIFISGDTSLKLWASLSSGGWSLFGMIAGVFVGARLCSLFTKERKGLLLDAASCALPLIMAAERFAERFFNGFNVSRELQAEGFPKNTFLAVQDEYYANVSFLATYLCAAIASIALFLILVFFLTRKEREDGDLWILFMILCGAGGVMLESLRYDMHLEYHFVRFQEVIAAIFLVIGVVFAGIRNRGAHKGLFRTAVISLPLAIAACGGIEFALDRTTISHYLLYGMLILILAVPVAFGILLLRKREKGAETL